MKQIFWAVLCCSNFVLFAQPGFNIAVGLEQQNVKTNEFHNVLTEHDTIVIFGVAVISGNQQVLTFTKMDTFGNIIISRLIAHPTNPFSKFISSLNHSLIKTSDGGYAISGTVLDNQPAGAFVKLSYDGVLEIYKTYEPMPYVVFRHIVETKDTGFLIAGYGNATTSAPVLSFIKKINKNGDEIWQTSFGEPTSFNILGCIAAASDSTFLIGASESANSPLPPSPLSWARSHLYEVNEQTGVVVHKWVSEKNEQTGIVGLNKLADGWLYGTGTYQTNSGGWGRAVKLVRMDSAFNIVWEKVISPTTTSSNAVVDIKPLSDGNWVAVGHWSTPPDAFFYNYLAGFTYKFSTEGNDIWSRTDSIFQNEQCSARNFFSGVAELESGSIVIAGYHDHTCEPPYRSFGWVLKMSSNGCIDTLCSDVNATNSAVVLSPDRVWPIPFTDVINMEITVRNNVSGRMHVYAQDGALVEQSSAQFHQGTNLLSLNTTGWGANRYYVITIYSDDHQKYIVKVLK